MIESPVTPSSVPDEGHATNVAINSPTAATAQKIPVFLPSFTVVLSLFFGVLSRQPAREMAAAEKSNQVGLFQACFADVFTFT